METRLEGREETGAGGDGFRFGGRRHGHGHPLRRKKKKKQSPLRRWRRGATRRQQRQRVMSACRKLAQKGSETDSAVSVRSGFVLRTGLLLHSPSRPSFRSVGICILIDYGAE